MGNERRIRCLVVLLILLTIANCSSERSMSAPLVEEQIPPESMRIVGTSEAIAHIVDVVESKDGTIWVLNTTEPFLIAMQADGQIGRSWGRRGGGPNEFRNPNALVSDPTTARVWVYDRGRHALLRVDGSADAVEAINLPRETIPSGRLVSSENLGAGNARVWVQGVPAGFLVAVSLEGSSPFTRLWNTDLVQLAGDGSTEVSYAVSSILGDPTIRYGSEATEFVPYPLWALCPTGIVGVYDPLSNRILQMSREGALGDSVSLPEERRLEMTLDRIFRMAFTFMRDQAPPGQRPDSAAMYAQLASQWAEVQAQSSPVFPEYADLQCSAPNVLWLQQFDPDHGMMGRSATWFRLDAGETRQFRFPDRFQPLRFEADRVLGIHRDEFDLESVAWFPLPN